MRIQTAIDIDATPATVFGILVDFEQYPHWNPLSVRIDGAPEAGEVLTLHVMLDGQKSTRKHVVSQVDAPRALCWTIRTRRPWLMRGERCQRVEDLGDGRCRYTNDERVHGLLSGLIVLMGLQPKLQRALEATGAALKVRAEEA
jgi:hypothetical protein